MSIGQRYSRRQFPAPATLQAHNGVGNVDLGIPGAQAINLYPGGQPAPGAMRAEVPVGERR